MASLPIRRELSAAELRTLACQENDARIARRLLALAMALDGVSRKVAACHAGMDRQTLRDWVGRYNAEGVAGLRDRERPGQPALLAPELEEELRQLIEAGPDVEREGSSSTASGTSANSPCGTSGPTTRAAACRDGCIA
jgi:hypothetical protein